MKRRRESKEAENPWRREPPLGYSPSASTLALAYAIRDSGQPMFEYLEGNRFLNIALKASPAVVALVSSSGENQIVQCSGTIIERLENWNIVISSAKLIRRPTDAEYAENTLIDDVKICVHTCDGNSYDGNIFCYDFHYNIVIIRFRSEVSLATATLSHIDDSMTESTHPTFELHRHASSSRLIPGDQLIAMGRYFLKPFHIMAAPGEYRLNQMSYDCKELFMAGCKITKCGDGGPVINCSGEVIGIAYYDSGFTPWLPINIAYKWWQHYKTYGISCRPSLGIETTNFYAADLSIMEKVIQMFPSLCGGLIVEEVRPGTPAQLAGIFVDDVIVECDGKPVQSFLEFSRMMWDKVGNLLELAVLRVQENDVTLINLKMVVVETRLDGLNRLIYYQLQRCLRTRFSRAFYQFYTVLEASLCRYGTRKLLTVISKEFKMTTFSRMSLK